MKKQNILMIDDNILLGHFNSSDLYAEVEIDKTYEFVVTGSRNQVLSWYPNIHSINEMSVEENNKENETIAKDNIN